MLLCLQVMHRHVHLIFLPFSPLAPDAFLVTWMEPQGGYLRWVPGCSFIYFRGTHEHLLLSRFLVFYCQLLSFQKKNAAVCRSMPFEVLLVRLRRLLACANASVC